VIAKSASLTTIKARQPFKLTGFFFLKTSLKATLQIFLDLLKKVP